jgi:iron(III) transport system permease protein
VNYAPAWVVLAAVALIALYPLVLIVLGSFESGQPGEPSVLTLQSWQVTLSDSSLLGSVWNTLAVTLANQAISLPVAFGLAWIIARTDIPWGSSLEFLFWVAFFLPVLPVTLGWIMLLAPQFGLVNQLVAAVPFIHQEPFNIYSFWGIVWAHIASGSIAIKVMLLTPALRNLDASLEEASMTSGVGIVGTLLRVVIPIMLPTLSVVLLLGVIYSFQSFEIERVLGAPFRFDVFSTRVYLLLQQQPQQFQSAAALSTMILALMLPLIVVQRWITTRRRYTTLGGQFRSNKIRLGRWRLPLFTLVVVVALMVTVVPVLLLLMATFMKVLGFFNVSPLWTADHWLEVFRDPVFGASIRSTLVLSLLTAATVVVLASVVAYIVVRTRFVARAALDVSSWLPATLPGVILGLGLLWMILGTPAFRPLYGTLGAMIAATVLATLTTAVQIVKTTFVQLGFDLEEAARANGASWLHAIGHVLVPLCAPTLLLVGALSFISAAKSVSTIALLATTQARPVSLLQLDLLVSGHYESAAVVGVMVVLLTTGVALVARSLGLRATIAP